MCECGRVLSGFYLEYQFEGGREVDINKHVADISEDHIILYSYCMLRVLGLFTFALAWFNVNFGQYSSRMGS